MIDVVKIKKDFPFFENNPEIVYLDTAATSQTPQVVLSAMDDYYTKHRASVHRGLYKQAEEASSLYEKARSKIAIFIGAEAKEIIFTGSATLASNLLYTSFSKSNNLKNKSEILMAISEHHGSMLPLREFATQNKFLIKYIFIDDNLNLNYDDLETLINNNTGIVAVALASNVTGAIYDVRRVAEIAHRYGAIVVVDATAAAGHISIDVKALDVDFLYFSGHKMCGPTGIGILYGKRELLNQLTTGFSGGGTVSDVSEEKISWIDSPNCFEPGTPNIAGAIGLGAGIEYIDKIGLSKIHEHSNWLVSETIKKLSTVLGVTVYAQKELKKNVGIVSFTIEGIHSHDIAQILSDNNIAIRAGHHCAKMLVDKLKIQSLARVSFYIYNTQDDVNRLIEAVKKARAIFSK